jgi:CSLREA domain-containing protein
MSRTWARIVTLTVTVLISVGVGQAAAATLTVNTFDDNSGQGDGLCSLREAIAAVDSPGSAGSDCKPAAFGANTIVIPAGTTNLTPHFDPTTHETGEMVIASTVTSLTIVGAGEGKTTIAGGPALSDRLLRISPGATVTIRDLTLTGGRAQFGTMPTAGLGDGGPGTPGANGGAILNDGSLALIDAAVTNSHAGDGGGGGWGAGALPNGGHGGAGGPGGSGGGIYSTGSLTLHGATIAGNGAGIGGTGGRGGDATTVIGGSPTPGAPSWW